MGKQQINPIIEQVQNRYVSGGANVNAKARGRRRSYSSESGGARSLMASVCENVGGQRALLGQGQQRRPRLPSE